MSSPAVPQPSVYWLVRCEAPLPDYAIPAAAVAELRQTLRQASSTEWIEFNTVPGGRIVVRAGDVRGLEEWTPAVRSYVEEEERRHHRRQKQLESEGREWS